MRQRHPHCYCRLLLLLLLKCLGTLPVTGDWG
jgi:hypothetical protein